jgi:hypothetical protein
MKKFSIFAVAGAIAVTATVAFAAVTFDPAEGTGFVGKGEVQEAFGWNNHALQENATHVRFTYEVLQSVEQDCTTVDKGVHTVTGQRAKVEGVLNTIDYEARRRNQVNGFILEGWETEDDFGPNWTACPDGSTPHGAVRVLSSVAGLFVHHGSDKVELTITE